MAPSRWWASRVPVSSGATWMSSGRIAIVAAAPGASAASAALRPVSVQPVSVPFIATVTRPAPDPDAGAATRPLSTTV
jgi:hypothetical protein